MDEIENILKTKMLWTIYLFGWPIVLTVQDVAIKGLAERKKMKRKKQKDEEEAGEWKMGK